MRTKIILFAVAAAFAASSASADQPQTSAAPQIKSKEQIRCELFASTAEGKAACSATRAWITQTGSTVTDRMSIQTEVRKLTQPKVKKTPIGQKQTVKPVPMSDLYVNFELNSDVLTPDAQAQLEELYVAIYGGRSEQSNSLYAPVKGAETYRFEIAGHTDAVGSAAANKDLSLRRAERVAAALKQRGAVTANIVIKGYGATRPIEGLEPTNGMNRRVEIKRLN